MKRLPFNYWRFAKKFLRACETKLSCLYTVIHSSEKILIFEWGYVKTMKQQRQSILQLFATKNVGKCWSNSQKQCDFINCIREVTVQYSYIKTVDN